MSNLSKLIRSIGLAFLILLLSFGLAVGQNCDSAARTSDDADRSEAVSGTESEAAEEDQDIETLTMSIALEEGGAVDLEALPGDVTIGRWDGEEILVIVEKVRRANARSAATEPFNIKVTRDGRNVRIETRADFDWNLDGMDLSFRIMLPDRSRVDAGAPRKNLVMSKLASVVVRALHKEVLKWLVR